jgi:uridylate kinase
MSSGYRCALLKISGEALAGERAYGIDSRKTLWIASEIAKAAREGRRIGIVVGGGNILRGAEAASVGVPPLVGDEMGMVATVLNGLALRSAIEVQGLRAAVMSAFPVGSFVETFEREGALRYLSSGTVVVFCGGTGNPCFTTDSAAALRAVQIEADILVKGTQVDGVFDKDPKKHPDARLFPTISAKDVLRLGLGVMDAAAVDILGKNGIPAVVLNLHKEDNIRRSLAGEPVGTTVF